MQIKEFISKFKEAPKEVSKSRIIKVIDGLLVKFGLEYQLSIIVEEPAELIQAVSKVRRNGIDNINNRYNLIEELGDVSIIIEEIKRLYNISDEDINKAINVKLANAESILNED